MKTPYEKKGEKAQGRPTPNLSRSNPALISPSEQFQQIYNRFIDLSYYQADNQLISDLYRLLLQAKALLPKCSFCKEKLREMSNTLNTMRDALS
jgi:hypothetical protein